MRVNNPKRIIQANDSSPVFKAEHLGTSTTQDAIVAQKGDIAIQGDAGGFGYSFYAYDELGTGYIRFYADTGQGRLYTSGTMNFENLSGSMGFTSADYFLMRTAAGGHFYMDAGGYYYWRDRDNSNTVIMSLNSGTGALTVNQSSNTGGDLQVKGLTDAYLLFTDASTNRVGIGTNAPRFRLTVVENGVTHEASAVGLPAERTMSIQANGSTHMMIRDVTNDCEFAYGTSTATGNPGYIGSMTSNALNIRTNNTNAIVIDTSQQVFIGGATNNTQFEADGTMVMNGAATVWEDIQFQISSGRVGVANYPDWDSFTTNTSEYNFAVDDYIDVSAQELAHWWKEGSTVTPHLHITLDGENSSGSNQYAKYTLYISYADVNEVWTETSLTAEKTIPTGTADMTHLLLDMGTLALTNNKIGTQIKLRIKRIAATGGTEYPNHTFLTQIGFHAEADTIGSRQITTK